MSSTQDLVNDQDIEKNENNGSEATVKIKKAPLITNPETFMHLIKGNMGTGILGMPEAFKNAGYALGIGGIAFIAILCLYCMQLILNCAIRLRENIGVPYLSYAETAEQSILQTKSEFFRKRKFLARIFKIVVDLFICITQLGFCSVYFVFVTTNIKPLLDDVIGETDKSLYTTMLLLPIMALSSIRNLKLLSPFMTLANIVNITAILTIFYFLFLDLKPISNIEPVASISTLPLFFGTALYTFEGIALVLPMEKEMKSRPSMGGLCGVLNFAMTIVSVSYIIMGFFGYLEYGSSLEGSVSVSVLEKHPDNIFAMLINIFLSTSVFLSYALQFFVPFEILYKALESKMKPERKLIWEYVIRYGIVLFTYGFAVLIPDVGLFMALVGALSSSFLALIAPAIIYGFCIFPDFGPYKIKLIVIIFIISFGTFGSIVGTFVSVMDAIEKLG